MVVTKPRNPRYVALLAFASSSILIGGWLARPDDTPASPAPVPSETELQQLARRSERLTLESMTTYFAGIARQAEPSLVAIPSRSVSGVVWDARHIVTAPSFSTRGSASVPFATIAGANEAEPVRWGPHLPLTVLAAPSGPPALTPAPRAESMSDAGAWVLAVWRTATGRTFAVGNYLQSRAVTCGVTSSQEILTSISLTHVMAGGGLFDIDGHLLGIILPCNGNIAVIAAESIETILGREDSVQQRLVARYGVEIDRLSPAEQQYFEATTGLLVREVWRGQPGDTVGLKPGDIITAIDGQGVDTLEDLHMLAGAAGTAFEMAVQRGSKRFRIVLADSAREAATVQERAVRRSMFEPLSGRFTIRSVSSGSRAALAGIEPGDEIVGIDLAEPRSARQVDAVFAGNKPIWAEVERGRRRIGVLVQGEGRSRE